MHAATEHACSLWLQSVNMQPVHKPVHAMQLTHYSLFMCVKGLHVCYMYYLGVQRGATDTRSRMASLNGDARSSHTFLPPCT